MMKEIIKKIYSVIPFKKQMFSLLKKTGSIPESIYKHLYFIGKFRVKLEKDKSFLLKHYGYQLENEIFWEGLPGKWEKYSISLWINLCRNANTIFDIGANTGVYSLVAKTINPAASVYAFEPMDPIFQKLVANTMLNNYSIQAFKAALSNREGKMPLYNASHDFSYVATLNPQFIAVPGEKTVEVDVWTLRSFIEKCSIKQIDLMKIDVETHEVEVIEGLGEYLVKFKPTIIIEIIKDYVAEGLMPHFENLGYMYFNIDETSGVKRVDKLGISNSFNYLLCTPEKAKQLNLI